MCLLNDSTFKVGFDQICISQISDFAGSTHLTCGHIISSLKCLTSEGKGAKSFMIIELTGLVMFCNFYFKGWESNKWEQEIVGGIV